LYAQERENLEKSNDSLKVSDDDGIDDCGGPPSLEVSSISCSSLRALLEEQISCISIPRLTKPCAEEIQRDKCPLEQDVEESNTPNKNAMIPDGSKVDPTFMLQDDEEDSALAHEYTAGVKGILP